MHKADACLQLQDPFESLYLGFRVQLGLRYAMHGYHRGDHERAEVNIKIAILSSVQSAQQHDEFGF